jgi:23S rRNA (cytosine1962-C5)-methyltransferase
MLKEIILRKGRESSIHRKHPWVFSGAIYKMSDDIIDGDIVSLIDHKGDFLAKAHYQQGSISCRIISFTNVEIDLKFWESKLSTAIEYRKNILGIPNKDTNAYRLIHGEGDGLPGLIIDIYNDVAVIQSHSIGMSISGSIIATALTNLLPEIKTVSARSAIGNAIEDQESSFTLFGSLPDQILCKENGFHFTVDVIKGQKTGFFLDQRENRQLLKELSAGKSVLNCFCYTGGFSLYAAGGGALKVTSVDISAHAIQSLKTNVTLNPDFPHETIVANVMEFLKTGDECYDILILDPPAFAKSLQKRHNAVQAYKRLNMLGIKKVKPGGLLMTYSCSQVVDRLLFNNTITAALIESGRSGKIIKELSQASDHPVNMFHPEGHYLKGLLIYIED